MLYTVYNVQPLAQYVDLGCYSDGIPNNTFRDLTFNYFSNSTAMTRQICVDYCLAKVGLLYAIHIKHWDRLYRGLNKLFTRLEIYCSKD